MSGASRPMPCPWSHCFAMALPLTHRTDPRDSTVTAVIFPIHDVIGTNSWFGRCPASQLIVVPGLTEAGRRVLADADRHFVRQLAERINKQIDSMTPERREQMMREADEADRAWRHLKVVPPLEEDYFPGRPADAPEPGVGDKPASPVPADVGGGPLGKAEGMSSRSTLVAMIMATRNQIGAAQEAVAVALAALEVLERVSTRLPPSTESARNLGVAAVGYADDAPIDALAMMDMLNLSYAVATGPDGIPQAIGLIRAQITHLAGMLAQASMAAERYAQRP